MPTIKKRGYATPKQPEQEILTLAHTISAFMAKYRKQLVTALSVLAGVIVLAAGYAFMRVHQEQKAAPLVAAAYEYYNPSNGSSGDYSKALALFREVQNKYAGTKSAAIAQYYVGNSLVNLGQPDEALKAYQLFIRDYSGNKFLLGLVYQRMGYVYEGLGRQDDARKAFEQSETLTGPGAATVELAHLADAAGNGPEAEKKYKTVLDKLAGTNWSLEAMSKVPKAAPVPQPEVGKEAK
jgi:tetratricopeptide (TPR) repeat protein